MVLGCQSLNIMRRDILYAQLCSVWSSWNSDSPTVNPGLEYHSLLKETGVPWRNDQFLDRGGEPIQDEFGTSWAPKQRRAKRIMVIHTQFQRTSPQNISSLPRETSNFTVQKPDHLLSTLIKWSTWTLWVPEQIEIARYLIECKKNIVIILRYSRQRYITWT